MIHAAGDDNNLHKASISIRTYIAQTLFAPHCRLNTSHFIPPAGLDGSGIPSPLRDRWRFPPAIELSITHGRPPVSAHRNLSRERLGEHQEHGRHGSRQMAASCRATAVGPDHLPVDGDKFFGFSKMRLCERYAMGRISADQGQLRPSSPMIRTVNHTLSHISTPRCVGLVGNAAM